VCRHFGIEAQVCINKYDINEENSQRIEQYCREQGIITAGRIPFDNVFTEAMIAGLPVVEYSAGEVSRQIESMWNKIEKSLVK
jgi:MinD superfamily P-loop ATPase